MRLLALTLVLLAGPALAQAPEPLLVPDTLPVLIGGVEALQDSVRYPEADRLAGVEGRVVVRFVVDAEGVPVAARVVQSVSPGLDSAAVAAIRSVRFTPGLNNGKRVAVRYELPVSFFIPQRPSADDVLSHLDPGMPWDDAFTAYADSGSVAGGRRRVVFLNPEPDIERVVADIEDGRVRQVEKTARAGSDGAEELRELAATFSLMGLTPRPDGFWLAADLITAGLEVEHDVAIDLGRRTFTVREARCETSAQHDGCSIFPLALGGLADIGRRVAVPPSVRIQNGTPAVVTVRAEINLSGTVVSVAVESSTVNGGSAEPALAEAVLAAVWSTRFEMGPRARVAAASDRTVVTLPVSIAAPAGE